MEPEMYTRRIDTSRPKPRTKYLWVKNGDFKNTEIVDKLEDLYVQTTPSDRFFVIGEEVRLQLSVVPVPSSLRSDI